MTSINFPTSPSVNDEYTFGDKTWIWNGYAWDVKAAPNTIIAVDDTSNTTLFPVMVGSAGNRETPKVTTSKFVFDAVSGNLNVNGNILVSNNKVWHVGNDGAGSGLDADLLDGQNGSYYLDYNNSPNKLAANIVLTGNVTGSANAVLTANSTIFNITTVLQNTGVVARTYGNATIIPVFTVDARGRITSASNVSLSAGTLNYADLQNKPAANIVLSGDVSGSANAVLTANSTLISISTTVEPTTFDSRYLVLATGSSQFVTGPVTFENNVFFTGNVTTISANNLIIDDNFIYLNSNDSNTNIDFGFVGNYNDGIYRHAGFFRDASDDGVWKVFDQYLPEPDEAVDIDTNNVSFRLANFAANIVYANKINVTSTAVVENFNADFLDGENGSYYTNYVNAVNKPAANILLTGDISGSANTILSANSTVISISTTIQPNSITLGTDTTGDYVANLVQGSGITITSGTGESSTPTIAANVVSVGTFVGAVSNNNILSSILAVDGAGSGLDADLLDGQQGSFYANDAAVVHITGAETITGLKTFSNSMIISTNVATDALRITQLGTGNAFVVEDETSPDSTAFIIDNTGNTYIGTRVNTNNSKLVANGTISETVNGVQYLVASQYDIGTDPNEIPLNGYLGTLAYQDAVSVLIGNLVVQGNIAVAGNTVWTAGNDGSGSGLDADLLDGNDSTYYTNYVNIVNPPSANIVLTGDVSGSANATLTANSTVISISTTIQPNSVALGTDTTGDYVANLLSGNGIVIVGSSSGEGTTPNVTLSPTGVTASSYGNTTAVGTFTVNQWGQLTSASSTPINFNYANVTNRPAANIILTGDIFGSANAVLTPGSTVLSITTTIQPNSVALGTDTTGDYVANLTQGFGITLSGLTGEGATPTIAANVTSVGTFVGAVSNSNILSSILTVDGAGSNLDADLLDGQQGTYYTNYVNQTNKPSLNVIFTGSILGSSNLLLNANTNILTISTLAPASNTQVLFNDAGNISGNSSLLFYKSNSTLVTNNVISTGSIGVKTLPSPAAITANGKLVIGNSIENANIGNVLNYSATGGTTAFRPINLIDTSAAVKIARLDDGTNGPAIEFQLWNTGLNNQRSYWDLYTTDAGLAIRDRASPVRDRIAIDSSGRVLLGSTASLVNDSANLIANVANLNLQVLGSGYFSSNLYLGTLTNTYDAKLVANGYIAESVNGVQYLVASQYDIGTDPNEIPLNQYLGTLAYQDAVSVSIGNLVVEGNITVAGNTVWTSGNDGSNSGLDADLLDGNNSTYYTNYVNIVNNPAANIILTGDVSGSANASLTANSTVITISTTIQPNSITLGTDTTGDYVANLLSGNGIVIVGSATGESTTPNITLSPTGVTAATYGNTIAVGTFTVNQWGRITSASTTPINFNYANVTNRPAANILLTGDVSGSANAVLTPGGTVLSISTTIQPNSVALGADTTGDYVANLTQGAGITITSGTGEGSTPTIAANVTSVGTFVGAVSNANILSSILTVDGAGSNLDADLLDGQQGSFYANDAAVVHITGTETITGAKTFSNSMVISTSLTSDALRITQLGTGNAFVVEDETSPDSTAFIIDNTGNTYIGTRVNTNNSKLVANGTISESVSGTQYLVASQYDIGTDPNEIPLNGYLGTLAYQDSTAVVVGQLRAQGNAGIGYGIGAGSNVTQITSRTTSVAINSPSGAITLVSAAGNASWQTFSVTNSVVASTDTIIINQKSGTDLYLINITAVAANTFNVTFATTGGTTTEQPVFNFAVLKASIV